MQRDDPGPILGFERAAFGRPDMQHPDAELLVDLIGARAQQFGRDRTAIGGQPVEPAQIRLGVVGRPQDLAASSASELSRRLVCLSGRDISADGSAVMNLLRFATPNSALMSAR